VLSALPPGPCDTVLTSTSPPGAGSASRGPGEVERRRGKDACFRSVERSRASGSVRGRGRMCRLLRLIGLLIQLPTASESTQGRPRHPRPAERGALPVALLNPRVADPEPPSSVRWCQGYSLLCTSGRAPQCGTLET